MTTAESFLSRVRQGGIGPQDGEELRIRKSLLVFAMGLMTVAPMLWLALYWQMGVQFSATLPLAYQLISVATFLVFVQTRNLAFFQYAQLGLFLFFPFVVQLAIGNFITSSGAVLWGLLAPVVAVPVLGARASLPWFLAYVVLVGLCAFSDFQLGIAARPPLQIPSPITVLFFMLNFIGVSGVTYFVLRYGASLKEKYEAQLQTAHRLLQLEQERSEKLLLNILPGPVAERLKKTDQPIADGFADVTVMFADIVNFTDIAAGMAPSQIFAMLNKVFSGFDELAEKHGLEKIKTIGDAYMVAGGLDDALDKNYTEAIADMALDMQDRLAHDHALNDRGLEIRMGIGTGPVVAGVVGKKKFIYDLWGDTVNIASRITSEGVPGAIHVDATTYRRLRNRYGFEAPRKLNLKGKGETLVYRLTGSKAHDIRDEPAPEAA